MLKLTTFLVFFLAALFVPLWPLLALIGLLYLAAWLAPGGGYKPPGDSDGNEPSDRPPPAPERWVWRDRYRIHRRPSTPFNATKNPLR